MTRMQCEGKERVTQSWSRDASNQRELEDTWMVPKVEGSEAGVRVLDGIEDVRGNRKTLEGFVRELAMWDMYVSVGRQKREWVEQDGRRTFGVATEFSDIAYRVRGVLQKEAEPRKLSSKTAITRLQCHWMRPQQCKRWRLAGELHNISCLIFNRYPITLHIRGNTKIGPVLEVMVTKHFDRYGIEIKIDSVKKDGTQSWMVISRWILHRACCGSHKSLFIMTKCLQARRNLLRYNKGQNSLKRLHLRHELCRSKNDNWKDRPSVPRVDDHCRDKISKIWLILRHSDDLRVADGATEWRKLLSWFLSRKPRIQKVDNASMAESLGERKQQEKIPVLRGRRR